MNFFFSHYIKLHAQSIIIKLPLIVSNIRICPDFWRRKHISSDYLVWLRIVCDSSGAIRSQNDWFRPYMPFEHMIRILLRILLQFYFDSASIQLRISLNLLQILPRIRFDSVRFQLRFLIILVRIKKIWI